MLFCVRLPPMFSSWRHAGMQFLQMTAQHDWATRAWHSAGWRPHRAYWVHGEVGMG